MRYKLGVGLLLFGILLTQGSYFDIGFIFFIVGSILGCIGFLLIIAFYEQDGKK